MKSIFLFLILFGGVKLALGQCKGFETEVDPFTKKKITIKKLDVAGNYPVWFNETGTKAVGIGGQAQDSAIYLKLQLFQYSYSEVTEVEFLSHKETKITLVPLQQKNDTRVSKYGPAHQ